MNDGKMRILGLEPYYGGSHKAFIDSWIEHSRHQWTLLTLPARKWKWRMRHSSMTFAEKIAGLSESGWDVVFATDMLNLAELYGLSPQLPGIPSVLYFHENQLTYPVREESKRDHHFVFSNILSAAAASEVWFNSAFHRDDFTGALKVFIRSLPDFRPEPVPEMILAKSRVMPQGINPFPERKKRKPGPIRILWCARWEPDKRPDIFFEALSLLKNKGVDFRLDVLGGAPSVMPRLFGKAKQDFAGHIDRWGFCEKRGDYTDALLEADIAVSTADHEFFGVSMVEAAAAGAFPMLPERLAYPEVFSKGDNPDFFYEGSPESLARRIEWASGQLSKGGLWSGDPRRGQNTVRRYQWPEVAADLDDKISRLR